MNQQAKAGPAFANRLLRQLDDAGIERFAPSLERVTLRAQQVLYPAGDQIREIYFPETAVICMVTVMENGQTIESSTVGKEGASWISVVFSEPTMPCQTTVAVGGDAYKVKVQTVESEIELNGRFQVALSEYSHALLIAAFRTTACNGLHNIHQRTARWMLNVLDRTKEDRFLVTHEFLSCLLGVRRSSVTEIVNDLKGRGLLDTGRGVIEVVNREALEQVACECYTVMRENYEKLK